MPPRLPAHRSIFFVASVPSVSRSAPRSLSSCGARRGLATFADHSTQGAKLCFRASCHGSPQKRTFHSTTRCHAPAKNPYEVLGVKKDAGASEIKDAYYQLARKLHPDTNKDKGAHERFVEVQTAYDLLSDEKKRAAYDRYGSASQQEGFDPDAFASGRGPFGAGGFGFQDFGSAFASAGGRSQGDLFETLFGSAFGGRGGRARGQGFTESYRGDDIEASVGVSFLEACKGVKRSVTVTPVMDCKTCSGSGLKPGAKRSTCSSCGGSGTRTFVIESGFQMASTCPSCHGSGTTVPRGSQCGDCSGLGKVKIRKTVSVDVPPGVEDGMTIRVPGAGDMPISGHGSSGDLLVRVNVAASKVFRRQGVNLYHDARIPMHTAVLGGKVRVPTLDGEVDVRVPAGTQQGEECVLRGRGVTNVLGGEKGDLFVAFAVQLPRSLSKRQREMLEQYADDVEGRTASRTTTPSSAELPEESEKDTWTDKHGTDTFPSSSQPPASGDWLSRAWTRIKRLIGD